MKLIIDPTFHDKYPDVTIVTIPVENVKVTEEKNILTNQDYEAKISEFGSKLLLQPELKAYREFYARFKLGPEAGYPSVENLIRRYQKETYVPHVNSAVDTANKIAIKTLVATGLFDLDKIEGDLYLRFSKNGEEYHPLGGSVEVLTAGTPVISDDKHILNIFPYRDSVYTKITRSTKNLLVLVDLMDPLTDKQVEEAAIELANCLGGMTGEVDRFKPSDERNVVTQESIYRGKKRVFSGSRSTGRLHLGNLLGAIYGYIALQNDPSYECVYMAMDVHTTTTPFDNKTLQLATRDIIMDYMAAGLDPEKAIITKQSLVPEHTELSFLFSSVISVGRMQDLPTFKEKIRQHPNSVTMALLNYPVLMASDILIYKAGLVPVGIDQEPHLEVARDIARKMNDRFGTDFPQPMRFATAGEYVPSLLGVGKMSKSIEGSYINLVDDLAVIKKRLAAAPTDSGKGVVVPTEGGVANLLKFIELFEGITRRKEYEKMYLGDGIRYGDMKKEIAEAIYQVLQPIQLRRKELESNLDYVDQVIRDGAEKARAIARTTVNEVKQKMGLG